ncbi:MAG TPA: tetratricopeptide repeat protein [Acidobacteriota bacterium]|nr:tetratricopeptide repeat protein [Acidobacteriota bacterium]
MNTVAKMLICLFSTATPGWWLFAAQSQTPTRKPALIRDTEKAEEKEEADTKQPKEVNPLLSEKNLKIGDFYFKKKNYAAAIERYRDAVEYQPDHTEAYEALIRAYERNGDPGMAVEVYKDFIKKNPDSPKVAEFRARLAKLTKSP